jgi:hypothetical protein
VLTLRAGVGSRPARSRASVARRLDVTVRRVARLENTGLRKLRTLAQSGGCRVAGTTTVGSGAPVASVADVTRSGPAAPKREGGGSRDSKTRKPPATGGVDASATPGGSGVQGATQSNAGSPGGFNLLFPLLLLLMAAGVFAVGRSVRREHASPVPGPAPEASEATAPTPSPRWDDPPPEFRSGD